MNLIGTGAAFVALLFMTRSLGPGVYGIVAWTFALLAAINSVSDLGFTSAHIKRISEGNDLRDCVSTYTVIQLALTGVMVVTMVVSVLVWAFFFGGTLTGTVIYLIALFILYYALVDIANIVTDTYVATMETAKCQTINLVAPVVRMALVIFVALSHMGAVQIGYAYVVSGAVMLVIAWSFIRRDRIGWTRPTLFRSYYKFALPVALIVVLTALNANLDKVFIGLFGTNEQVAYYSAGQTLLSVFILVGSAVTLLLFPSFSKMYADGDLDSIKSLTRQAERYISMIIVPVVVIIVLFPDQIASILFGSTFAAAGEPMRILALGLLPYILTSIYIYQIYAINRPGLSAKLSLLNFIIFIGLMLVLIPTSLFGIMLPGLAGTGAAIAYFVSAIVVFVVTRMTLKRILGSSLNPKIGLHIIAACLAGSAAFVLSQFVAIHGLIALDRLCRARSYRCSPASSGPSRN